MFTAARTAGSDATRSLREAELRRTLAAAITVMADELRRSDPALAGRLRPMLTELADTNHGPALGCQAGSEE